MGKAELLEKIAKEMGNVHTNRRELTGKDGKPIQVQEMSAEQVDRELATLLIEGGLTTGSESDAVH